MKVQKTLSEQEDTHIITNRENVENVKIFTLGAVFTDNYDDSVKIKRRRNSKASQSKRRKDCLTRWHSPLRYMDPNARQENGQEEN